MTRRALVLLGACAALSGAAASRPPGLGDVVDVRHWSYPDYTRVVIELTRPPRETSAVHHLPADPRAGRPERLYVDVEGVWVGRRYVDGIELGDGLLRGVRIGQNTLTASRVVVDLDRYERHRIFELTHPHRIVLDVYGAREGGESLEWPHDRRGGGTRFARLPTGDRPVRTVVVDAGHGGRDPGAIGVGGVREKDVTLLIARALADRLESAGFRVVSTREDDGWLSLEERTAIAEAARGDLFLSIHANAARRRSVRGIETYYLDEDHERHSLTVAARENGIERGEVNALQRTLARLRVSEVSPHSRHLAQLVQRRLVEGLAGRFGKVPDLGVKKGPFYVLFLSDMPAILLEVGFLTNRDDAKRLADSAYRDALASQIASALVEYRSSPRALAMGAGG